MSSRFCSKVSRSGAIVAVLAFCAAAIALAPRPAMAVLVMGGSIETDGSNSTVDRFYFTVSTGGTLGLSAIELIGNPPRIGRLAFKVYRDDGVLDASDLLLSADSPATGIAVSLTSAFAIGNYVAVVSQFPLATGEFGPVHLAPVSANYNYEFSAFLPTSNETNFTRQCQGNLNGTFAEGANACPAGTPVPEPSSLALLAAGAGLLHLARRSRRTRGFGIA